jgi:hypothetical protein
MALKLNTNSSALVLPAGGTNSAAAQDIRDIRDPLPLGPNLLWVWITLAAAALAALAWWYSKRKKAPAVNPALLIPPHRRAKERLRAAHDLISDPYAFCSLVSDVIRLYLEERFNLHAPDRTTEEFLAELREGSQLNEHQKAVLENFLIKCDLVKFARVEPSEPELRDLLESAERLVDETREVAAPQIPEPAQK